MKSAIMQPYLFPYIGYWQLINAVDTFVIYDDVNFIKGGWINRNNILLKNQKQIFSLALDKASPNKKINEILIMDNQKNRLSIIEKIKNAYHKAPNYNQTIPLLKEIILFEEQNLSLYIENSIKKISNYLNIKTDIIRSTDLNISKDLYAQNRVLEICKKFNTNIYVNPIGGQKLYSHEVFEENHMNLYFIQTHDHISYKQFENYFIPNLSIIDILMFNNLNEIQKLLEECRLIK